MEGSEETIIEAVRWRRDVWGGGKSCWAGHNCRIECSFVEYLAGVNRVNGSGRGEQVMTQVVQS